MKIAISSGHAKYVRGASGYLDEVDEARRVVETVADKLRAAGHEIMTFHDNNSTSQNQNLNAIVNWHNSKTRDLDTSIHFNAYQTTSKPMGTEVLYVTQQALAGDISGAIARAADLPDRGAKYRSDLFFLNSTEMPAVLVETVFVDSSTDAAHYNDHYDAICTAIAEGLVGEELETEPPDIEPPPPGEVTGENRVEITSKRYGDFAVYINETLVSGNEDAVQYIEFAINLVGDTTLVINGEEFHNKPPPQAGGATPNHCDIETTIFGGSADPNYSAYPPYDSSGNGEFLNDTDFYVALPVNVADAAMRERGVRVWNCDNELNAVGAIRDKGPWVVNDDDYVFGAERPIAETCHDEGTKLPSGSGPNAGKVPSNAAGLDLSPALAKKIKINGKGRCDWAFVDATSPNVSATIARYPSTHLNAGEKRMRANNLSVNKTKKETQHDVEFAKGGDTPMFGEGDRTTTASMDAAGPQKPGRTEQHPDASSGKYAEGGKTKMFGFSPSVPATSGITGPR